MKSKIWNPSHAGGTTRKLSTLHVLFLASMVLYPTLSGDADTVVLLNGKTINGAIEARTADKIMVRTNDGLVTLGRDQIRSIRSVEPATARLKMAEEALNRGDVDLAMDHLSADSATSPSMEAIALILHHEDKIIRRAAHPASSAPGKLDNLLRQNPAGDRLLTAIYAARNDWAKALYHYKKMHQTGLLNDPPNRTRLASTLLPFIERAWKRDSLDDNMIQLADAVYPDAGGTTTTAVLRNISVASHLSQNGRLTSAVQVLADRVAPSAPELALQRSLAILMNAREKSTTQTVAEICHAIEIHYVEKMPAAVAPVFEQHAAVQWEGGQFTAADDTADRLSQLLPDEGATLKHRVEFYRRRSVIAPQNSKGAYELAIWAKEMGLTAESRRELELLLRVPEIRENAELQLRLLSLQEGKAKLDEIKHLVESGRSAEALTLAAKFRDSHPDSPLLKKVSELEELARYSKWNRERSDAARADAVYQNAERMFLQGRFKEALHSAQSCSVDYPQTPAAEKAGKLRQRIEKEISRRTGRR